MEEFWRDGHGFPPVLAAMSYFVCFGLVLWVIVAPQVDQTGWGGGEDGRIFTSALQILSYLSLVEP